MRFLIAGLGSIGRRHLQNLLALGERDIVLYRTFQSTLPDGELEGFPVERDLEAALAHHPDAVIVSNPTRLHLQVAIPAAEAGCHLLLEKPVSDTMEHVQELVTAVRTGGGQVLVGYQYRFHPGLQQVKRLLEEGAIGRPVSAHSHWGEYLPGWHPWEDYRVGYSARSDLGGGVILTLSHPLDYFLWLLGEVEALWSFSGRLSDLELPVEDVAEIGLRFATGVLGSIHLDYCQLPASHRLEITGTQGSIRWENTEGTVHVFRSNRKTWESLPLPPGFERNQLFLAQMRHFLETIRGNCPPACSLEDGLQAMQLCLAAIKSQAQGTLVRKSNFHNLL